MDTVLSSLIAVAGTLIGGLGGLHYQQRAALRAERRRDLQAAGGQHLTALTTYRAAVYALSAAPADQHPQHVTTVRDARARVTATRDALLLITQDPAVRTAVGAAISSTFALGDDIEQDHVTTGRPAALNAHHTLLAALEHTIRNT